MKILIIAGTKKQYHDYLLENKISENDTIYAYEARSILGHRYNKIIEVGTARERKDYREIKKLAEFYLNA